MKKALEIISEYKKLFHNQCYINGKWRDSLKAETLPVLDPATGDILAEIPWMGTEETIDAINSAQNAFNSWSKALPEERAGILFHWCELIRQNAKELAHIITAEQGKPLKEAEIEVYYAASFVSYYAAEACRINGEILSPHRYGKRIHVMCEPIGVVACITPWNFPAAMITRKAAPALAAGCTVVIKPSEETPLTAFALAELAEQAGVPAGVLNLITGEPEKIGREFCDNLTVRKISFTGSTRIGRLINSQSAKSIKRMSLELGGNAPFIVFEDANMEAAVKGAILCKFRHSGQTCICANRFLIQSSIFEEFKNRLLIEVKKLKIGNGFEDNIDIGPLINRSAVKKVKAHIADALEKGATLLTQQSNINEDNNFVFPTVISGIKENMLLAKEETFGPVAGLMSFDNEAEAIKIANSTEYGLAGYFYTENIDRAWRVADTLECGMVGINTGFLSIETAPFGGIKQSGFGREGSNHGIKEFLQLKYINFG